MHLKCKTALLALFASGMIVLTGCSESKPGSNGLDIAYSGRGIERLSYRGFVLEDLEQNPDDAFHIWHMKATDLQGKVVTKNQYQWGEVNTARSWDAAKHTWKYFFDWGAIAVEFVQTGDTLHMNVTETNNPDSKIIFDGATIYPFVLHFRHLPRNFHDAKFAQLATNVDGNINGGQGIGRTVVADYGDGQITSLVPGLTLPLYHGFDPLQSNAASAAFNYTPIISSTSMDSMPSFLPQMDRPVPPGKEDRFTVSLRFAPSGTPAAGQQ